MFEACFVPQPGRQVLGISPHRLMTAPLCAQPDGRRVMRAVDQALLRLRQAGRRSILIVDTECGDGRRLIEAACQALALGFRVIDARGFDRSPTRIAAASRAARADSDPAIRFDFWLRDEDAPLPLGDDQADILLAGIHDSPAGIAAALDRDGILIRHG